jgi:UDP-glucuronate 4-epimerase
MRILVTGGAGFIGSHLAERLLDREDELTILDNFNDFYDPQIKEKNLASVQGKGDFSLWREDLLNWEALTRLFEERRPEAIVHLAAYAGVRPSLENPALYSEVNVTGTVHLLELARTYEVKNFVFGSSSSVYGVNSKVPFHEDDSLDCPISPYASTKRAAELLCYNYHHNYDLPVTSLRFFTVYGPRQRPEMAIHKFARMIDQGEEIPVYHQGRSQRDYTYIDDIVQGILAVIEKPFSCETLNLGNSRTVQLLELIRLIEGALGKEARMRLLPAQMGDVPITYADISRARERIDYRPTTAIEEGIQKFVKWFRSTRV